MKKNTKAKPKRNTKKGLKTITSMVKELEKTIDWQKKGFGQINKLKSAVLAIKTEHDTSESYNVFKEIEAEESIIQEMIEWYQKNSNGRDEKVETIFSIIEAFLEVIKEKYAITFIENVNEIIDTPARRYSSYSFQNKFNPKKTKCLVIKPGLKIGKKVISPALLEQIEEQTG